MKNLLCVLIFAIASNSFAGDFRWQNGTLYFENNIVGKLSGETTGGIVVVSETLRPLGDNTFKAVRTCKAEKDVDDGKLAAKPLFIDPVYDGAADPTVIWNGKEQRWFMLYTNRRTSVPGLDGVSWVHGTPIGIAESTDGGASWHYKCDASIDYGKDKNYTYWAPDVIEEGGKYHMFLTVVPGIFSDWARPREIVRLVSDNLIDWTFANKCELASNHVIDADMIKTPSGKWRMYYNNEQDKKSIYYAESEDLVHWIDCGKVIGDRRGEGAVVFFWKDKYFMIVDNWEGLGVYSSADLENWTRQPHNILGEGGTGKDDGTKGQHADVIVSGDKAYIFYFTHPGRIVANEGKDNHETRRSVIQVAELEYRNGQIVCNRNKPVYINLQAGKIIK
jgi:sucrose-6-phosphate hydrolase SacC (GH32 family)